MPDTTNTSQVGQGQVGDIWVGTDDNLANPPLDPATIPWRVAREPQPAPPPALRRSTLESFVRGPELAQPNLDPSTVPFYPSRNSGEPPTWRRSTLPSFARGPELPQPVLNPLTIQPLFVASTREQEVTPPQRYRTLPSFAQPLFPSSFPAQQVQLFLQGINHRGIGTPSLSGGVQGLQAFIRGKERSSALMVQTAKITKQLNTTGTCECKLLFETSDTTNWPSLGDQIILSEFNTIRFSGLIDERRATVYPISSKIEFTVNAFDWNGLLQRRLVTKDYDPDTLYNIVSNILTFFLAQEGISPSKVDQTIQVADSFSFNYIKISDAFNQLALATNTIWWIDHYKVLHFIKASDAVASTFQIVDGGGQADTFTVSDSLANYRNVQYVRTPQNVLSESFTLTDSHTFTGAQNDIVCATRYPLTSEPQSVKENGIELVGTDRLFELKTDGTTQYPAGGEGYYWAKQFFGVFHWPSNSPPTAGTTLSVTYTGVSTYTGNVVVYRDATEIANMAAATGGSGIFEEIEEYSGSATYSQLLALATGIEQGTAPPPKQFSASTVRPIEDIGRKVTVSLAKYNLSQDFVIQGYTQQSLGKDLGYGTTFRTSVTLVSSRTLGNWVQWFERLLARLQKAAITPPTEKPTWGLAFDTPGNTSAGLSVGSMGQPYPIQVGQGRIQYVSAIFDTAADATIKIDIFLNGVSIFDNSKLQYLPGDAGQVKLYTNLAHINVTRDDVLTLQVLQCGTINPGKNGTVIVVIGPR